LAAYLVVESVPLLNTAKAAPPGQRMPGINVVACIEKPAAMDYQAWLDHWLNEHKRMAIETQSVFGYVRNVVVRRLSPDGPAWDGIVEETFPAQAVTDPMLWYDAGGSKEKMQRNLARMLESVGAFLEVERVESNPMSQYLIGPGF
jgi:hypothetical protein